MAIDKVLKILHNTVLIFYHRSAGEKQAGRTVVFLPYDPFRIFPKASVRASVW